MSRWGRTLWKLIGKLWKWTIRKSLRAGNVISKLSPVPRRRVFLLGLETFNSEMAWNFLRIKETKIRFSTEGLPCVKSGILAWISPYWAGTWLEHGLDLETLFIYTTLRSSSKMWSLVPDLRTGEALVSKSRRQTNELDKRVTSAIDRNPPLDWVHVFWGTIYF